MRYLHLLALFTLPLTLVGCYTPVIEGAQQGYDAARRDPLHSEAAAGDAVAQYKLGDAYCCIGGGPMDNLSVYDNSKATYWYCKSAHQDYHPAQMRLARVYSGHAIHGLHLALRASALVGDAETDFGVALMWATVAARDGDSDAVAMRDKITQQATDKQLARAAALGKDWHNAPCRWADVFPASAIAKEKQ